MTVENVKAFLAVVACLVTVVGGSISGTLFYVKFERRIERLESSNEYLQKVVEIQRQQMKHIANRYNADIHIDE